MYITYRQLFGYGWWSTLWRLTVVILLVLITMIVTIVIISYTYDYTHNKADWYDVLQGILIVLTAATLLTACILYVTHCINKRTYRNNNKEIISNL